MRATAGYCGLLRAIKYIAGYTLVAQPHRKGSTTSCTFPLTMACIENTKRKLNFGKRNKYETSYIPRHTYICGIIGNTLLTHVYFEGYEFQRAFKSLPYVNCQILTKFPK